MIKRKQALPAAIAALALLAGCGGGGDTSTGPSATLDVSEGGSSIEDKLGFTRTGVNAAQAQVENDIARCMKEQGFDYLPSDPVAAQAALTGKSNLTDTEFEQLFGYGISTLYDRGTSQSNPNAATRQGMSEADRRAWDRALYGENVGETFRLAVDTGDFTKLGGCTKTAADAVLGGSQLRTTLQRKLDELDESVVQDQRVVKAHEAWAQCMRAATGNAYEDSEAVEDEILVRLRAIAGSNVAPGTVAAPSASYAAAALDDLQRAEVELSNADRACEEQHVSDVETTVREEKEARFREDNATLLSEVKPLGT
jgi:hypothetical protein